MNLHIIHHFEPVFLLLKLTFFVSPVKSLQLLSKIFHINFRFKMSRLRVMILLLVLLMPFQDIVEVRSDRPVVLMYNVVILCPMAQILSKSLALWDQVR